MRLLILRHLSSSTPQVEAAAREHGARNLAGLPTRSAGEQVTLFTLGNDRLESFISAVEGLPDLGVVLVPHEVMSVPPGAQPDSSVEQAGSRSPLEIYLHSLNSIGGWGSYFTYAAVAGLLAWSAFYAGTLYLLVAAMLVAPFPNPALNCAIATARGHGPRLLRSVLRYFLGLAAGVLVAFGLSAAYGVEYAGGIAQAVASLSTAAILLPLVAGIVGGTHLYQSEESSLVTAAAAGLLIAAALSPPMAVLGIALWTGEAHLAVRAGFLLLLQLVGINLTAAAVFRLRGMGIRGPWYAGGSRAVAITGWTVTALALVGLIAWQFSSPDMQRDSRAREAITVARAQVESLPDVQWVTGSATIHGEGADALLVATVQGLWVGDTAVGEAARARVKAAILSALEDGRYPNPLVDLTLLER